MYLLIFYKICSFFTETAVRKKYKVLRDQFRVELKKDLDLQAEKTPDWDMPMEDFSSTWPYFRKLFFLRNTITGRRCNNYSAESWTKPVYIQQEDEQPEDPTVNVITPAPIKVEDNGAVLTLEQTFKIVKEKQPKRRKTNEFQNELDLEDDKMELLKRISEQEADDCRNFLLSLVPSMRDMSPKRQCFFRIKVQELVMESLYGDE